MMPTTDSNVITECKKMFGEILCNIKQIISKSASLDSGNKLDLKNASFRMLSRGKVS